MRDGKSSIEDEIIRSAILSRACRGVEGSGTTRGALKDDFVELVEPDLT